MYNISVIGATGAVGIEMVKCLHELKFPVSQVQLLASARSAGKTMETPYGNLVIEEFTVEKARQSDFCFMAVSGSFAKENAPKICAGSGPVVIDNSSAFRYDDAIPLVIPEINPHVLYGAKLIANPNCTTAIAAMALWPIHKEYGIRKAIVSTYQAASGAGAPGMEELKTGIKDFIEGREHKNEAFAHPLPFNVIPHIDAFQPNGYTKEEMKVSWETCKIFGTNQIQVSCTAVRVPTLRAHAEAISIETILPASPAEIKKLLGDKAKCPGLVLVDNPEGKCYPMPLNCSGKFDVQVGRIRKSLVLGCPPGTNTSNSSGNSTNTEQTKAYGLEMFVCGDQLLRGAALNAVLIGLEVVRQRQEGYTSGKQIAAAAAAVASSAASPAKAVAAAARNGGTGSSAPLAKAWLGLSSLLAKYTTDGTNPYLLPYQVKTYGTAAAVILAIGVVQTGAALAAVLGVGIFGGKGKGKEGCPHHRLKGKFWGKA